MHGVEPTGRTQYSRTMKLSDTGKKLSQDAGILRLMDDLGQALSSGAPQAMFGGGTPAHIPEVTAAYEQSLRAIVDDPLQLAAMLGNYDTPQGYEGFIRAALHFFNDTYSWGITADNIAITPGSQSGFFMLFNLLAGQTGGIKRRIMLPLVPEYIGYVDQVVEPDGFVSIRPAIEKRGAHEFKYRVDLNRLTVDETIAALCVSRPTNPSGNVLTDEEMCLLSDKAAAAGVPLIIDNAYGLPFPGVMNVSATLPWNNNTVLSFSLSKVGLPSSRVGVFVGPPELMRALSSANAILNLASPSFGQYVVAPLLENGELQRLSERYIRPYYFERAERMRRLLHEQLPDGIPWRLHVYEGSYFFWLWCEDARKTSMDMYDYLKQRGVIVVPGEYFFPGQDTGKWPHARECLRLNFARPDAEQDAGVIVLADMMRWAYR